MFFVFNKQKIYSYTIAASTVVVLFILSFFFLNTDMKATETSTDTVNNTIENLIVKFTNNLIVNK